MEFSIADQIADVSMQQPHVLLLGAGASRAALPVGDRNGRMLPVMADFVEVVGLVNILERAGLSWRHRNFEDLYSEFCAGAIDVTLRRSLEDAVFAYFDALVLPDWPTLYDQLILSLRPKDVIATFNWDPFLIQAVLRNGGDAGYPKLLFLHGNVLQGYCVKHNFHGLRGGVCSECDTRLTPVRLLYPIAEKNYEEVPAIRSAWEQVRWSFQNAFMVTIFGYSAPHSDRGAIELLQESWGTSEDRAFEQLEIIDIRDTSELVETWRGFIHTHHYHVRNGFHDSWLAKHPRRTGEAYRKQYMNAAFIDPNPIPNSATIEELRQWFEPLLSAERAASER